MKNLENFVQRLSETNSNNDKKDILKTADEDIQKYLFYTYNPFYQYNVTSDNIKKFVCSRKFSPKINYYADIFKLLDDLRLRKITGHGAIQSVCDYVNENLEFKELIYKIIDKDWQVRISEKLINQAIPSLIPTFEVALANSFEKINWDKHNLKDYVMMKKLDGCRCITKIENGNVSFWSRQGKEFKTLNVLKKEIEKLSIDDCVLDGEICIIDEETGIEDFQSVMKEIRRKDHTISKPKYILFDYILLEEFEKGGVNNGCGYLGRLDLLKEVIPSDSKSLEIIEAIMFENSDPFTELQNILDEKVNLGWEGLILRKEDSIYQGKRSNDLVKVKKFFDDEYRVKAVELGKIDDGHGHKVDGLSSVVISHKGYDVNVGSGFTFDERIRYFKNPDEINGKVITVKYFSESKNKEGGLSLRFPTIKTIHGVRREV